MSVSNGNELLQELYARLTGLWFNEGKYAGKPFPQAEVMEMVNKIAKEYEDEIYSKRKSTRESESENGTE